MDLDDTRVFVCIATFLPVQSYRCAGLSSIALLFAFQLYCILMSHNNILLDRSGS